MLHHQHLLHDWLKNDCQLQIHEIQAIKGDASLRQYYRVLAESANHGPKPLILMDARQAAEKTEQFIFVDHLLKSLNVRVPDIYHIHAQKNLLLLEDLGHIQLLDILNSKNVSNFYSKALDTLATLQKNVALIDVKNTLPTFNQDYMLSEVQLFQDWFLAKHLDLKIDTHTQNMLHQTFHHLLEKIDQFPKTMIHRDYHSRNLMVLDNQQLGVIDFQDAMFGPRAYDVVSLLKDCYIVWDEVLQRKHCQYFLEKIGCLDEQNEFWYEYQLCGLQRHIKVLGIFARLAYRDQKINFLNDLPRVWHYTLDALKTLHEFQDFHLFLKEDVEPLFLKSS